MKKSEITKQKIEEAAFQLFAEKGFEGASTAEIAGAAGVAEGTIFRYFPTKKSILSGLVIKYIERFGEAIVVDSVKRVFMANKDKPIEELLKAIILDRYQLFKTHAGIVYILYSEVRFHPDLLQTFKTHILEKIFAFITEAFTALRDNGVFRDDVPFEIAVRSFIGSAMLAIGQREFFYMEKFNRPFEEELDIMIEVFLNGIRKR